MAQPPLTTNSTTDTDSTTTKLYVGLSVPLILLFTLCSAFVISTLYKRYRAGRFNVMTPVEKLPSLELEASNTRIELGVERAHELNGLPTRSEMRARESVAQEMFAREYKIYEMKAREEVAQEMNVREGVAKELEAG
ncbi:MAG: hypothetical protein Q9190_007312 [Brigantiaea leucoxantha]